MPKTFKKTVTFACVTTRDDWVCVPKEDYDIITVSGGEYEFYWYKDYICPKNINLEKLKEELEEAKDWGSTTDGNPHKTLKKFGCVEIVLSPKVSFHKDTGFSKLEVED